MDVTHAGRSVAATVGAAALLLGLSSCAVLEGPTPETPVRVTPPAPESPPVLVPDGTAEDNLEYFQQVIREFSEGEQPVQGRPLVDAVVSAGFEMSDIQVSHDFSRTNLVADSIFVAVRMGETCLLGQVVTENREWASHADAAVGPNNDICMIGETRPIDW